MGCFQRSVVLFGFAEFKMDMLHGLFRHIPLCAFCGVYGGILDLTGPGFGHLTGDPRRLFPDS
jgi:small ligand-binding sensory domain FIST